MYIKYKFSIWLLLYFYACLHYLFVFCFINFSIFFVCCLHLNFIAPQENYKLIGNKTTDTLHTHKSIFSLHTGNNQIEN